MRTTTEASLAGSDLGSSATRAAAGSTAHSVARRMLGGARASVAMTDAYKFAMAQAGFPLRDETFYLSFRRTGWYFVPFDLRAIVHALRPVCSDADASFLDGTGYGLGEGSRAALDGHLDVWAAPAGSWVREREPILRVTGPSFLASWLEPLAIWLHYPMQVATEAIRGARSFACTCADEAEIAATALRAVGCAETAEISVDSDGFVARAASHAAALVSALDGKRDGRLLEVGMRSTSCLAAHELALRGAHRAGLDATSNVHLARKLGGIPAGTAGHEHQQRWGDDLAGFRALRDMRPVAPSYLVDTYDAKALGIPAAVRAMRETPARACAVRFDSGDPIAQMDQLIAAQVAPTFVFMDGLDAERIEALEAAAKIRGVPPERRIYGVGGYLVGRTAASDLTRDRVSAVYKLAQSGDAPVMKLGFPDKASVPGHPTIFRRTSGDGPVGLIGQEGEDPPAGYRTLASAEGALAYPETDGPVAPSPSTRSLMEQVRARHRAPHDAGDAIEVESR